MSVQTRWLLYNLLLAFAFYWTANLLLWYPWSISPVLGITLMLTVMVAFWAAGVYACLVRYPGKQWLHAAASTAGLLLMVSALSDYFFFGLIRGAMEELYHPTTLYGYGFLVSLPFLLVVLLRKRMEANRRKVRDVDFIRLAVLGVFSLLALVLIIQVG